MQLFYYILRSKGKENSFGYWKFQIRSSWMPWNSSNNIEILGTDQTEVKSKQKQFPENAKMTVRRTEKHSQRFERKSCKRDEHQSGDGLTKWEGVPRMSALQNESLTIIISLYFSVEFYGTYFNWLYFLKGGNYYLC